MVSINTNLQSLIVQNNLTKSSNSLNKAIERLTTGFKINHASDNAANYSITENMSSKLSSYMVAEENTSMGLDLIQTQSATLETIQNLTTRLRALAEQAHNGTYGAQSLEAINQEAEAITQEITRIAKNAEYNGIQLFDNSAADRALESMTHDGFLKTVSRRDTSAMTTLASVKGTKISGSYQGSAGGSGTYSISTAEELMQLAEMVNSDQCMDGITFVLANDIDMSGYEWESIARKYSVYNEDYEAYVTINNYFWGTLDGNGYTISNLNGNPLFDTFQGTIKNLKIENSNIQGAGTIAKSSAWYGGKQGTIQNCCVINGTVTNSGNAAGIVSSSSSLILEDTYFTGSVTSKSGKASGIANTIESTNYAQGISTVSNVGAFAEINGTEGNVAALLGSIDTTSTRPSVIEDLFYDKSLNNNLGIYIESAPEITATDLSDGQRNVLQVGINEEESSQIEFSTRYRIKSVQSLIGGSIESLGTLENIDAFINTLSKYQTQLGAIENRLMSNLDSIGVNIENLTSSRSTLKDADVAKESSNYIKAQILQQASVTLLSTANMTPELTLRLLGAL